MSMFMDIGRAPVSQAPPACARSSRRCSPARSRAATWASTSTAPTGASSSRPAFLGAVLVLGLVAYGLERSRQGGPEAERSLLDLGLLVVGAILGALLFAGSLADGGESVAIGLIAGPLCALLGGLAVGGLAQRARRRLDPAAAGLLIVYADTAALVLAAVAIFVPPLSFVALIGFALLLVGARRREGEKYAGLRVLR